MFSHLKAPKTPRFGFTLAELLISLAILGVIATFTIPKILSTQQNQAYNASAKEVAGMISNAYQQAKTNGSLNSNMRASDFVSYFNHLQIQSSGLIDSHPNRVSAEDCGSFLCIKMHGGGTLMLLNESFSGTTSLNAVRFIYDPNGQQDTNSTLDGPGKAVCFMLYYDGFVTTRAFTKTNTCLQASGCVVGPGPYDPSWFSWN